MGNAEVFDRDTDRGLLADNAVARSLDDTEAAVGFLARRRNQHVKRRSAGRGIRDVVHLAVGDGDGAGEARARDIGQGTVDRREQTGAGIATFRNGDGPQLEVAELAGLLLDCRAGAIGKASTIANRHRGRLIHNEQANVGKVLAAFLHDAGAGKPEHQDGEAGGAQDRAAGAAECGQQDDQQCQGAERGDRPDREQGLEAQSGDDFFGSHCPNLCRMAGTWTWSPL